ncbi:MAG: nickel pincer cofactor biosynthesis protein LarB [Tissierellia bacterium]|nr:nickel pincer cofactor biosynthesis protein LarB [Tissierellia bacterium]
MKKEEVKKILEKTAKGEISVEEGYQVLKDLPFQDIGFAKVDNHREIRTGFPEVIYGASKTIFQIKEIMHSMVQKNISPILITKISPTVGEELKKEFPNGKYEETPQLFILGEKPESKNKDSLLVLCGGTSDLYVAEEAAIIAEYFGNHVKRIYDVGVAGIHRLFAYKEDLERAKVIICVAGMEGALVSVVGGLVDCPVIGVPTSVGYGASFQGLAPLLTMLNSCAPGTTVVNIDNGFGAAYTASLILKNRSG